MMVRKRKEVIVSVDMTEAQAADLITMAKNVGEFAKEARPHLILTSTELETVDNLRTSLLYAGIKGV